MSTSEDLVNSSSRLQVICVTCGVPVLKKAVYKCSAGHDLCRDCFSELYCEGSEATCLKCMTNKKLTEKEDTKDSRMLFSDDKIQNSLFKRCFQTFRETDMEVMMNATSKKPIRCPHDPCKKIVAVDFFGLHFETEHAEVPKVRAYGIGNRCDLQLDPLIINNNSCSCIGLIKLPDEAVIMVMVSRIPCPHDLYDFAYQSFDDSQTMMERCNCMPSELVVFWCWSNYPLNLNYTIAVSNPITDNRIKYAGPLLTLHQPFERICIQGNGLVMNHLQLMGFSDNFSKDAQVHVVFRIREDESST